MIEFDLWAVIIFVWTSLKKEIIECVNMESYMCQFYRVVYSSVVYSREGDTYYFKKIVNHL